ncbi:MAG TPA: MBL fold metallo-hydrolase [Chakrabartia sp.]|nr:MBL fold metallo-hydrolase [Chakrabartia sp.]
MAKGLRWFAKGIAALVIIVCLAITVVPPFLDRIYYDGPESGHYDGSHFFNPDGDDILRAPTGRSRGNFLWRWITGQDGRAVWPDSVPVTQSKPAARVEGDAMVATWIGHATVLVQTQGLNILTDPIWAERAGPFGIGPKRVAQPAVAFDDLPKIDAVLVSHNHYDHLDQAVLKRLWDRDKPKIITSLGNDVVIRNGGAEAVALDWGQRIALKPGVEVAVTRNHHWGSRWGSDARRALWSSFVVITPAGNMFFAGDTGFGDGQWPAEAATLGPVRLAIIPVGAFRFVPGGMSIGSHIGPIEAERVFAGLKAAWGVPIHWGTFQLSNEARETPPKMLAEVMKCGGYADPSRFAARGLGEAFSVPPLGTPEVRPAPPAPCLEGPAVTGLE